MEALQTSLEELRTDIKDYKDAFDNYEYSKYTLANGEMQGLIDSLQAMVQTLTENAVEITSYQSGSAFCHETVKQFMTQAQMTAPYLTENQQGIQDGLAIQAAIYQKQQQEYEEACKERMDTGTAQMLGGTAGAVGTVAVMTVTALAAPVIPALIVIGAGACVFVCCTSDTMEGYENYQYGKAGDLTTAAIDPVRDVCFDGDMAAYNDFKLVSQFALTVAGAWAGGATVYGLVAEVGRECVGGYASGQIAGGIADVFDLGYGGTMATEVIVETLIEGEYDGPNAKIRNTTDVPMHYDTVADINFTGNYANNLTHLGIVDSYNTMPDIDVGGVGLSGYGSDGVSSKIGYEYLDDQLGNLKDKVKINQYQSAEGINAWWEARGYNAPYKEKTVVQNVTLKENTKSVRVYDGVNSNLEGGWVMRDEDIKGLTPKEIQAEFALGHEPKFIGEMELKAGDTIRLGEVGPNFGFDGGGIQIDLQQQWIGDFTELGKIEDWR